MATSQKPWRRTSGRPIPASSEASGPKDRPAWKAAATTAMYEAVIAAPDLTTWHGRRDRALLLLALQTGLRVSELINLSRHDVVLGPGAHVRCLGKGRKERATPIRKDSINVLRGWITERGCNEAEPLFVSNRNKRLSRDAVEQLGEKVRAIVHGYHGRDGTA